MNAIRILLVALHLALPGLLLAGESLDYINTWLILGTFENDPKGSGIEKAWFDEASLQPTVGLVTAQKAWTYFDDRLFSRNYDDYQDLLSYFRFKRNESVVSKVVYAHTYIYSAKEINGLLYAGADGESIFQLNGEPVLRTGFGQWQRDAVNGAVTLKQGWNRLLVKVANKGDSRLGFYVRFATKRGHAIEGLTWSVGGALGPLKIATSAMEIDAATDLPVAWREWSYVGARPDPAEIFPPSHVTDEAKWILYSFIRKGNNLLQASDFILQAQGGKPPYLWSICDGNLPPGLTIAAGGGLVGTISKDAELKKFHFVLRVKDAEGNVARKKAVIDVKERPNKSYEEARLVGLVHSPEFLSEPQIEEMVALMKTQGNQIVMPISYNNGELEFRWPSRFAPAGTRDTVGLFKAALERHGIQFGMYMGNLNLDPWPQARFGGKEQHLVMEEALRKYKPVALWFDWPTRDGEALDALYSMIRTIDPDLTIVLNGSSNGSNGDWDQISFEGWGAWGWNMWGVYPVDIPWPKKHSPESWRLITDPTGPEGRELLPTGPPLNSPSDWQEYMRVQLAMIGDGFVADIDHTASMKKEKLADLSKLPLMEYHSRMGEWASPSGLPPLYPSYTQVNPGPLESAPWGYNLVNTARDVIYLHLLKNPRGKSGLPNEPTLTVGPISAKIKAATWMNQNRSIKFEQRLTSTDKSATIHLEGIVQDPIDTIIKLELGRPLPNSIIAPRKEVPPNNLANFRPARLLGGNGSPDLLPSSGNVASFGNDGRPETSAVGGGQFAWSYEVDLGRVFPVKKVAVTFGPRGYATEYEVLLSDDGVEWKNVATAQGRGAGQRVVNEFAPTDARFVRVHALKPDGPGQSGIQMAVGELEVYE